MKRLLLAPVLLLAAGQAGAATLVVELYDAQTAETPFKTIHCDGPICGEDGLMPVDGVLTPVAFAVRSDPGGRLRIEMARGLSIRYELRPEPGKTLTLGDERQAARLYWMRSKQGQAGYREDLLVRKDADLGEVWVKARIER